MAAMVSSNSDSFRCVCAAANTCAQNDPVMDTVRMLAVSICVLLPEILRKNS